MSADARSQAIAHRRNLLNFEREMVVLINRAQAMKDNARKEIDDIEREYCLGSYAVDDATEMPIVYACKS